jgi:hypothetical protein
MMTSLDSQPVSPHALDQINFCFLEKRENLSVKERASNLSSEAFVWGQL